MKFDIKNRFTGAVLFSGEGETLAAVVTQAVKTRADLADVDLAGANLAGAYLAGALNVSSVGDAPVDPPEPYVRATTPGDFAARAERYRQRHPEVPVVPSLDRKMLDVITAGNGVLEMARWHSCETTHCRAGWAITLAGEAGKKLEEQHGPYRAGGMIYRASTGRVPHFFATNERALEDIKKCAIQQK